jgi:hypothetical protein
MKRARVLSIILIIVAFCVLPLVDKGNQQVARAGMTYTFQGGKVKTIASAPYQGGVGDVYPVAFNAAATGGLTVIFENVNMSLSRLPLPNPLTGPCPLLWPPAISRGYFGGGITRDDTVGPDIWPEKGAWVWLFNHYDTDANWDYYLAQTFRNPGFTGPDPSLGINSPYIAVGNKGNSCGWNGPYGIDPWYDTFDIKLVYTLQPSGKLRLTPYIWLHETTDPYTNPAGVWLPFYSPGDCFLGDPCLEVPPEGFDFTRVMAYVLIGNGKESAGNIEISWESVQVEGVPNYFATLGLCKNGGYQMYSSPSFLTEQDCINFFSNNLAFVPIVNTK